MVLKGRAVWSNAGKVVNGGKIVSLALKTSESHSEMGLFGAVPIDDW